MFLPPEVQPHTDHRAARIHEHRGPRRAGRIFTLPGEVTRLRTIIECGASRARRSPMNGVVRSTLGVLLAGLVVSAQDRPATLVETLHFHHVHLNSMNPAAAAAYYPKPFAESATKTTFNGYE